MKYEIDVCLITSGISEDDAKEKILQAIGCGVEFAGIKEVRAMPEPVFESELSCMQPMASASLGSISSQPETNTPLSVPFIMPSISFGGGASGGAGAGRGF